MKFLKELLLRNMPIFVIGLITVLVFVGIIVLSERNVAPEPTLKIVNEDELIAEHNYFKGPVDAKVVLVEFSDFQCPACALFQPVINGLATKFPELKIIYKHYPLPQHQFAKSAARASMAAGEQDAFWEFHDELFSNQDKLGEDLYLEIAKELGLNEEKFKADKDSEKIKAYVDADIKTGNTLGVSSTPTFFLNGKLLNLNAIEDLEKAIQAEFDKLKSPDQQSTTEPTDEKTAEEQKIENSKKSAALEYGDTLDKAEFNIRITDDAILPSDTEVRVGQTVVWKNDTANEIVILPRKDFEDMYPEMKDGITIAPGQTGAVKINNNKKWVYMIKDTMRFGYITPLTLNSPLILDEFEEVTRQREQESQEQTTGPAPAPTQ